MVSQSLLERLEVELDQLAAESSSLNCRIPNFAILEQNKTTDSKLFVEVLTSIISCLIVKQTSIPMVRTTGGVANR